jgi:hypothetical protein
MMSLPFRRLSFWTSLEKVALHYYRAFPRRLHRLACDDDFLNIDDPLRELIKWICWELRCGFRSMVDEAAFHHLSA